MNLFILTLTWNGEDKLKNLTPSLFSSISAMPRFTKSGVETKWLVRDNGSNDGSVNYLRNNYPYPLEILEAGHNRESFAGGVNSLWKLAKPSDDDLVLLLNNDVIIKDPLSIMKMIDLQRKTKADVVGCRLLFTDTTKLQHAGVIFSAKYNNMPYHYRPGDESDVYAEKDRWFQAVTAAFCIVTGSALRRINGLDEGYRWAFEDIDMCLGIGATGGKIAYCGSTTIYHEESASLKKNPVHKMFMGPNVDHFRKKWTGKYQIDHDLYLKNPDYKVIK
jgi:GT2 family glycosyltransferase